LEHWPKVSLFCWVQFEGHPSWVLPVDQGMQHFTLAKHRLGDAYRNAVSAITSNNTESRFIESGMLTPEEFLQAGDQLTFKFPTWRWESGDPSRRASYLPGDRQYLITRNVPCRDRVRALDYALDHNTKSEDDWLLPPVTGSSGAGEELRDIDDLRADAADTSSRPKASIEAPGLGIIDAKDDFFSAPAVGSSGLPDFSDLDAQLQEEDPSACPAAGSSCNPFGSSDYIVAEAPDAHIVQTRTYDLSITYDKYYQTPRLWLFGYDESGEPLKPEQVYEDVLSDYVSKTVTVDPHPLTGTPTVSIHPCKHAQVMKKVVQDWIEQGITPRHDLALFVFLKFISSVVPTINYDFTMEIEF
jgi:ubiquitin-like-conjugating enzyme ATG3